MLQQVIEVLASIAAPAFGLAALAIAVLNFYYTRRALRQLEMKKVSVGGTLKSSGDLTIQIHPGERKIEGHPPAGIKIGAQPGEVKVEGQPPTAARTPPATIPLEGHVKVSSTVVAKLLEYAANSSATVVRTDE